MKPWEIAALLKAMTSFSEIDIRQTIRELGVGTLVSIQVCQPTQVLLKIREEDFYRYLELLPTDGSTSVV